MVSVVATVELLGALNEKKAHVSFLLASAAFTLAVETQIVWSGPASGLGFTTTFTVSFTEQPELVKVSVTT